MYISEHDIHKFVKLKNGKTVFIKDYFGQEYVVKGYIVPYTTVFPFIYSWTKHGIAEYGSPEMDIVSFL